MGDPNEPSIWLLMGLGMLLLGSFILLLWGVSRLSGRPKSEEAEQPAVTSRPIEEEKADIRPSLISEIMSTLLGAAGPIERPATPLPATHQEAGQPIAKPGNGVNAALPGNDVAEVVPEVARDIIQFWTKVEDVERIIAGGKIGQAEAVEIIFQCKRSGRPDSLYARAVAAIKARSEAAYRERQARLVELQAAASEHDR